MAATVWRGYITFGLISIPVRLLRAARSERVSLRQLYQVPAEQERAEAIELPQPKRKTEPLAIAGASRSPERVPEAAEQQSDPVLAPVRRVAAAQTGDEILPETKVIKGYEVEKGRFVPLTPDELRAIEPKTATQMELLEFVKLSDIDPVYFETSYYVQPESGGEKAYAVLWKSLRETGLIALGKLAMHRREHITILRPGKSGLIAHTMYFASEVRADQEYRTDAKLVSTKELELANALVDALAGSFDPSKYGDTYRQQLERLIAAKAADKAVSPIPRPSRTAPVIDIMESLRKSLAQVKKPAATAEASAPRRSRNVNKRSKVS